MAHDEASFSTVTEAISSGLIVVRSPSTPSTITRAEPPEPIDGAHNVTFLLSTVTHDNPLVHQILIFRQLDLQVGAGTDLGPLAPVSHVGEEQHVIGRGREREGSVGIGRSTLGGSFYEDCNADKRLSL